MIEITDKKKCCGCSACVQICPHSCISMSEDEEGFNYPIVDNDVCVDCHLCEKVCPVINRYEPKVQPLNCFLAKTKNESVRNNSSSGGIFTELATHIIQKGGVVFGVKFTDEWQVEYGFTESIEGLSAFRGSKYVQASVNSAYIQVKDYLKQDKLVLFTGTPCFVSGLNHYLRKNYKNLLTMDIVCHSIPSPKIWKQYLCELEVDYESKIQGVTFRNKSNGWTNYSIRVDFNDNKRLVETHDDNIYMKGFLQDLFTRPSCSECPARNYTSGSDITIADAWQIDKYHPEKNDEKGISHILVNTEKGKRIIDEIKRVIDIDAIDYSEVEPFAVHLPLTKSSKPHPYRKVFFEALSEASTVANAISQCFLKNDQHMKRKASLKSNILFKVMYKFYKAIKFS